MRSIDRRKNEQNRKMKTFLWFMIIIFASVFYIKSLYKDIDSLRNQVYSKNAQIESEQNYIKDLIYKNDSISKTDKLPVEVKKQEVYYQPSIKKDTIIFKKDSSKTVILDTLDNK